MTHKEKVFKVHITIKRKKRPINRRESYKRNVMYINPPMYSLYIFYKL